MTIFAATGHRPNKLGGYGEDVYQRLKFMARFYLRDTKPKEVISGMALGWDQAWADAAVAEGIPFIAAVPFEGQENIWPEESKARYRELLGKASSKIVVCPGGYAAWKMQRRNEWMVNICTKLVALWDGTSGGTGNCIKYAESVKKPIDNLWSSWRAADNSVRYLRPAG
jgi:uncharacterized phage-like protein YoqJ